MAVSRSRLDRLEQAAILTSVEPTGEFGASQPLNIIDFATNSNFLGLNLYPRQATVLKVMTLSVDLLTEFDYRVLDEWAEGYRPDETGQRWVGVEGTTPDIVARM